MGQIKTCHVTPGDRWRTKEEMAESERKSQSYWDGIDNEKRQAMLLIVKEALTQLMEDPNSWVPTSIEPENDNRLDIFISLHLAEVDDEVVRRKLEAERALHDATVGVRSIHADLAAPKDG